MIFYCVQSLVVILLLSTIKLMYKNVIYADKVQLVAKNASPIFKSNIDHTLGDPLLLRRRCFV